MSLIMDVLEKPDPGTTTPLKESKPLPPMTPKSFLRPHPPQMAPKQRYSGPSSHLSAPKRMVVVLLVLLGAASAGCAVWYFFASPTTARSSASRLAPADPSRIKPATHFSWSAPGNVQTASVSAAGTNVLQGVILDAGAPLCLIEGKILKVGDVWDGRKVTAITGLGVSLADKQGNASFIGITK